MGEMLRIAEKAMDEVENEVYDASNEDLPGGSDVGIS
jgi:hypothetical protein